MAKRKAKPKGVTFNRSQRIARKVYGHGDYRHVRTLDECRADVGDGLFTFIMVELATKEGCTGISEAVRRLEQAQEDIGVVLNALQAVEVQS